MVISFNKVFLSSLNLFSLFLAKNFMIRLAKESAILLLVTATVSQVAERICWFVVNIKY